MRYLYTVLIILVACNRFPEANHQLLHEVERLAWSAPDSALLLLDRLDTTLLDATQYAEYVLLKVQAKDKTECNITGDTAIFQAKELLVAANDTEKAARAGYYAGRVFQERDSTRAALREYLEAEQKILPLECCDYLKGLIHFSIGDLYFEDGHTGEAIARYRGAIGYFQRSEHEKNEMLALNAIGSSFLVSEQFDSALYYYTKVSEVPAYTDEPGIQGCVIRNIGIISQYTGEPEKARQLFLQALELNADEQVKARLYICLSQAYQGLHRNDSAAFFMEQALVLCEQNPKPPMAAIYKSLIDMEESRGNYPKALEYAQKQINYERLIHKKYEETQLAEFEKKYNYMAEKEKTRKVWLLFYRFLTICLLIVIVLLAWGVWSGKRITRQKREIGELNLEADENRKEIASLKEAIAREQENIRQLKIEKKDVGENTPRGADIEAQIQEKEENIGQLAEKVRLSCAMKIKIHLKFYERYELFKKKLDEEKLKSLIVVDRHLYGETGQINWDTVWPLMPKNIEKSVEGEFKALNTTEVRIGCLLLFDVPYADIADILHINQNSAHTIANRIRKKLDITDIPAALKCLLHK